MYNIYEINKVLSNFMFPFLSEKIIGIKKTNLKIFKRKCLDGGAKNAENLKDGKIKNAEN